MLANFFGKSKPINFVVIVALFVCYFSISIVRNYFFNDFSRNNALEISGYVLLFSLVFFFFNFIVYKNNLTFDNSYAFLLFVTFLGFFIKHFLEHKILALFLLSLFFLRKVFSLQSSKTIFQKLFDAGFWAGVLFILEPFTIIYFGLLYIGIYLHQKITIRTLLIPFVGLIAPLVLYFTYCFWFDTVDEFQQLFSFLMSYDVSIYFQNQFLVPLFVIGFFVILSLFLKTPKALSVNNTFRRSWILIIFTFLISLSFVILSPQKSGSEIVFLLFPSAIIVANGLETLSNKFLKDGLIFALVGSSFFFLFFL